MIWFVEFGLFKTLWLKLCPTTIFSLTPERTPGGMSHQIQSKIKKSIHFSGRNQPCRWAPCHTCFWSRRYQTCIFWASRQLWCFRQIIICNFSWLRSWNQHKDRVEHDLTFVVLPSYWDFSVSYRVKWGLARKRLPYKRASYSMTGFLHFLHLKL